MNASWIDTSATVTACAFQSPALGILAFGFPTTKNFRITFDYYAHGQLYSASFQSVTAIPQNTHIPIAYNPLNPAENSRGNRPSSESGSSSLRRATLIIGIAGSLLLSLLWLAMLRSCY